MHATKGIPYTPSSIRKFPPLLPASKALWSSIMGSGSRSEGEIEATKPVTVNLKSFCTHFRDTSLNPVRKHRTIPQINRLSLLWNNSESSNSNSSILRGGGGAMSLSDNSYSPLPILIGHESSESPLPVSCQTSLMQMSTNQYYLVVQINVDENNGQKSHHHHVYENYPWSTQQGFLASTKPFNQIDT